MSGSIKMAKAGYMGDPGLFGFIGKAIRGAANVVTGGISETVISGAQSLLGRKKAAANIPPRGTPQFIPGGQVMTSGMPILRSPLGTAVRGFLPQTAQQQPIRVPQGPGQTFIGAKGPFGFQVGVETTRGATATAQMLQTQQQQQNGGPPMAGYHWNKTGYWTSQGYVAPGTKLVKNRRRNPLNPRAASRAISRLKSAKRAVSQLNAISIRSDCPSKRSYRKK